MNEKEINLCVITTSYNTLSGSAPAILSNFIDILEPISNRLYVITGQFPDVEKNINIIRIKDISNNKNIYNSLKRFVYIQMAIAYNFVSIRDNIDIVILFLGTRSLPLPIVLAKLFKKKLILLGPGPLIKSNFEGMYSYFQNLLYFKFLSLFSYLNYSLADHIIVYSQGSIASMSLEKFFKKIIIAPRHYVCFQKFYIATEFNQRSILIGFVGRLSEEKGIMNFIEGARQALVLNPTLKFLILGDGPLRDKVVDHLVNNKLNNIKYCGWISHNDLPAYLNQLKLLVLPSYSEGLPNILLESMACGTPVLASSVGSIPDIISHNRNGFILKDNYPDTIANAIIGSLNEKKLSEISNEAHNFVHSSFNQEMVVAMYKDLLCSL